MQIHVQLRYVQNNQDTVRPQKRGYAKQSSKPEELFRHLSCSYAARSCAELAQMLVSYPSREGEGPRKFFVPANSSSCIKAEKAVTR